MFENIIEKHKNILHNFFGFYRRGKFVSDFILLYYLLLYGELVKPKYGDVGLEGLNVNDWLFVVFIF